MSGKVVVIVKVSSGRYGGRAGQGRAKPMRRTERMDAVESARDGHTPT
ncbi:hypothetical protein GCM10010343_37230 [Streptomyces avidinii]|nr:hypothetical protein GCM10010343_37230 [Streptomyces avidinii]